MIRILLVVATVLAILIILSASSNVRSLGATAIEQRRVMNDMQARATMAATCDIALGAYFRELSENERAYAGLVCGGLLPEDPAELEAELEAQLETPRLQAR